MRYLPSRFPPRACFSLIQPNFNSSAPIPAKYGATISGVTSSIRGGDHFGLRSLSITAARTPSRKSSLANTSSAARYSRTRHSSSEDEARASRSNFERHHHAARRFFTQRLQCGLRQFRAVAPKRGDDVLHPVMREPAVDPGLHRSDRACALAGRKTVDQRLDPGGRRAGTNLGQCLAQRRQFCRRHHGVGEARMDRVRTVHGLPGQAEIATDLARRARQQESSADVGKKAEADFGHRKPGPLGDDAVAHHAPKARRRRPSRCRP